MTDRLNDASSLVRHQWLEEAIAELRPRFAGVGYTVLWRAVPTRGTPAFALSNIHGVGCASAPIKRIGDRIASDVNRAGLVGTLDRPQMARGTFV
jgi:hypothetical protein